jgi:hypothetical protein
MTFSVFEEAFNMTRSTVNVRYVRKYALLKLVHLKHAYTFANGA